MQAVIFDFDGTIVDSLPAVIRVIERVMRVRTPLTAAEIAQLQNKSMFQIARAMRVPYWKLAVLAVWGRRMVAAHMDSVRVHPGMETAIAALHQEGRALYVVSTNRADNVKAYVRAHGLEQYFTGIYGSAWRLGKRLAYRQLMRREGLQAGATWSVGDEPGDVRAARYNRVRSIAVTWGFSDRLRLSKQAPTVVTDAPADIVRHIVPAGSV